VLRSLGRSIPRFTEYHVWCTLASEVWLEAVDGPSRHNSVGQGSVLKQLGRWNTGLLNQNRFLAAKLRGEVKPVWMCKLVCLPLHHACTHIVCGPSSGHVMSLFRPVKHHFEDFVVSSVLLHSVASGGTWARVADLHTQQPHQTHEECAAAMAWVLHIAQFELGVTYKVLSQPVRNLAQASASTECRNNNYAQCAQQPERCDQTETPRTLHSH
jgi:hypothetical protein